MVSSGPKASKTSRRSAPLSLSSVSSSWLRANTAHCESSGLSGRPVSAERSGPASALASDRYIACMVGKSNSMLSSSPSSSPKNLRACSCDRLTSPEQDRVTRAPAEERAQVAQVIVRLWQCLDAALDAAGLEQERHGVHPEAGQPELHPEADDAGDLVAHPRVRDVQVGLAAVEAMQVVLAGQPVLRPDAGLAIGEDDVAGLLRTGLVAPDVPVAVRRVLAIAARTGTRGAARWCGSRPGRRSPGARGCARSG